jgi:hypothetical protein
LLKNQQLLIKASPTMDAALSTTPKPVNKPLRDREDRRASKDSLSTRRRMKVAETEWALDVKEYLGWLVLVPLSLLALSTACDLLLQSVRYPAVWQSSAVRWFGVGLVTWLTTYGMFRRHFMIAYVFAHEMSHLITARAFGAHIFDWHVGADGGWVDTNKSNVWISLAPYIVPLYSLVVLVVYGVAGLVTQLDAATSLAIGGLVMPLNVSAILSYLLGFTWCFHFTYTLRVLQIEQSDVNRNGGFFSGFLIILFNLAFVVALFIETSIEITWMDAFQSSWNGISWTAWLLAGVLADVWMWFVAAVAEMVEIVRNWRPQA